MCLISSKRSDKQEVLYSNFMAKIWKSLSSTVISVYVAGKFFSEIRSSYNSTGFTLWTRDLTLEVRRKKIDLGEISNTHYNLLTESKQGKKKRSRCQLPSLDLWKTEIMLIWKGGNKIDTEHNRKIYSRF